MHYYFIKLLNNSNSMKSHNFKNTTFNLINPTKRKKNSTK